MSEQKLTDWFSPERAPWEPGVYQREWPVDWRARFAFWDGSDWWPCYDDPLVAANAPKTFAATSGYQLTADSMRWRGLAEPPKGGA